MAITFPQGFILIVGLLFLAVAAVWDARTRTIPNRLTFPFIIIGLVFTCLTAPEDLLIKAVFLAALFLFGMSGLIGLGDIKLVMGLGVLDRPEIALCSVAIASLLLLAGHFIRRPSGPPLRLRNGFIYLLLKTPAPQRTRDNSVPFAPYLLAAYILLQGGILLWNICYAG